MMTLTLLLALLAASQVWGMEKTLPGNDDREEPAPAEQVEDKGGKLPGNCPLLKGVYRCKDWSDFHETHFFHYQKFETLVSNDRKRTAYKRAEYGWDTEKKLAWEEDGGLMGKVARGLNALVAVDRALRGPTASDVDKREETMIADGENYGSEEMPYIAQCKEGGLHLYRGYGLTGWAPEGDEATVSWTPKDDLVIYKSRTKVKDEMWIDGGKVLGDVTYECRRVDEDDAVLPKAQGEVSPED